MTALSVPWEPLTGARHYHASRGGEKPAPHGRSGGAGRYRPSISRLSPWPVMTARHGRSGGAGACRPSISRLSPWPVMSSPVTPA
jgi:hypothetical protein